MSKVRAKASSISQYYHGKCWQKQSKLMHHRLTDLRPKNNTEPGRLHNQSRNGGSPMTLECRTDQVRSGSPHVPHSSHRVLFRSHNTRSPTSPYPSSRVIAKVAHVGTHDTDRNTYSSRGPLLLSSMVFASWIQERRIPRFGIGCDLFVTSIQLAVMFRWYGMGIAHWEPLTGIWNLSGNKICPLPGSETESPVRRARTLGMSLPISRADGRLPLLVILVVPEFLACLLSPSSMFQPITNGPEREDPPTLVTAW